MTTALEILFVALFLFAGFSVSACVLLAGRADTLMKPRFFESDFEEA